MVSTDLHRAPIHAVAVECEDRRATRHRRGVQVPIRLDVVNERKVKHLWHQVWRQVHDHGRQVSERSRHRRSQCLQRAAMPDHVLPAQSAEDPRDSGGRTAFRLQSHNGARAFLKALHQLGGGSGRREVGGAESDGRDVIRRFRKLLNRPGLCRLGYGLGALVEGRSLAHGAIWLRNACYPPPRIPGRPAPRGPQLPSLCNA
jgi:hypothetical protein